MFVRIKKINGQKYGYLVKNTWTEKGPRQKVSKYLGKIAILENSESSKTATTEKEFEKYIGKTLTEHLAETTAKKIIIDLIKAELSRNGFKQKNEMFFLDKIEISIENKKVTIQKTPAVVKLNDGYLCELTLNNLIEFRPKEDKTDDELGYALAKAFSDAGIRVPKQVFIAVFEKMMMKN